MSEAWFENHWMARIAVRISNVTRIVHLSWKRNAAPIPLTIVWTGSQSKRKPSCEFAKAESEEWDQKLPSMSSRVAFLHFNCESEVAYLCTRDSFQSANFYGVSRNLASLFSNLGKLPPFLLCCHLMNNWWDLFPEFQLCVFWLF